MEEVIYDVTGAIVSREEAVLALFDSRNNTVMIVRPFINDEDKPSLTIEDPDGAERLYYLEKFGMITEEEFEEEVKKLTPQLDRRKLYKLLSKEFEEEKKDSDWASLFAGLLKNSVEPSSYASSASGH